MSTLAVAQKMGKLLREVLEGYFTFRGKAFTDDTANRHYAAFTQGKGNNRANNDATQTAQSDALQEHAVAKKCHLRHLFHINLLLQVDNRLALTPQPFEAVVLALLWSEDVDNYITEV